MTDVQPTLVRPVGVLLGGCQPLRICLCSCPAPAYFGAALVAVS
jgi:hypothetical protein